MRSNNATKGHIKGMPYRFIHGHNTAQKTIYTEFDENSILVSLTRGEFAIIDNEDLTVVQKFSNWHVFTTSTKRTKYALTNVPGSTIKMHRLIMGFPEMQIDHINRDGLDNRRANLRLVTNTQNAYNTGPNYNKKYKGISLDNSKTKWKSYIRVDGKLYYIGSFLTPEEAAIAYDEIAFKQWGTLAYLNFPERKINA